MSGLKIRSSAGSARTCSAWRGWNSGRKEVHQPVCTSGIRDTMLGPDRGLPSSDLLAPPEIDTAVGTQERRKESEAPRPCNNCRIYVTNGIGFQTSERVLPVPKVGEARKTRSKDWFKHLSSFRSQREVKLEILIDL